MKYVEWAGRVADARSVYFSDLGLRKMDCREVCSMFLARMCTTTVNNRHLVTLGHPVDDTEMRVNVVMACLYAFGGEVKASYRCIRQHEYDAAIDRLIDEGVVERSDDGKLIRLLTLPHT